MITLYFKDINGTNQIIDFSFPPYVRAPFKSGKVKEVLKNLYYERLTGNYICVGEFGIYDGSELVIPPRENATVTLKSGGTIPYLLSDTRFFERVSNE